MNSKPRKFPILFFWCVVAAIGLSACSEQRDGGADEPDWPEGLVTPIAGMTFPVAEEYLPGGGEVAGAARRGFLLVNGVLGRPVFDGEAVVAVSDGTVLRIDAPTAELTADERAFLSARVDGGGPVSRVARDRLAGRQVWLEHGDGFISRYGRLAEVAESLKIGQSVEAGAELGIISGGAADDRVASSDALQLYFELIDEEGRSLGVGMDPLAIHRALGEAFGEDALPRFVVDSLAGLEAGDERIETYPPDPIPETGFSLDVPEQLPGGSSRAVAVTWEGDDFRADSFFASLNGLGLGFIDAGNGAWLLLPAPSVEEPSEATLTVGGADRYGQTLVGQRPLRIDPAGSPAPLEVSAEDFARYASDAFVEERQVLARLGAAATSTREALWREPFQPPAANARVVRGFGQKLVAGVLRPAHPSPGLELAVTGETAVVASNAGRVALVETLPLRGRTVAVLHGGGVMTVYAGLDLVAVEAGQQVERGQVLGSVGSADDEDRFRWDMYLSGVPVDPRVWLGQVLPPKSE